MPVSKPLGPTVAAEVRVDEDALDTATIAEETLTELEAELELRGGDNGLRGVAGTTGEARPDMYGDEKPDAGSGRSSARSSTTAETQDE